MPLFLKEGIRMKRVKAACICQTLHFLLKEDMEQFLLEQGMELLDIDCSIRLEENDADITRLSVTAAFAEGYSGASAKMEEMLKARLGKRYELSDEQIHIYIRQ